MSSGFTAAVTFTVVLPAPVAHSVADHWVQTDHQATCLGTGAYALDQAFHDFWLAAAAAITALIGAHPVSITHLVPAARTAALEVGSLLAHLIGAVSALVVLDMLTFYRQAGRPPADLAETRGLGLAVALMVGTVVWVLPSVTAQRRGGLR